jgi:hypothetical protein
MIEPFPQKAAALSAGQDFLSTVALNERRRKFSLDDAEQTTLY